MSEPNWEAACKNEARQVRHLQDIVAALRKEIQMMGQIFVEHAPGFARKNFALIQNSKECGCYFCVRVVSSKDVEEYTDDGLTGICPQCGVDALMPGVTSLDVLTAAHQKWFTDKASTISA